MATLRDARAAKLRAIETLADHEEIRGIGIARTADGYSVKINVAHETDDAIPTSVDGVPVVVETVGTIRPYDAAVAGGHREFAIGPRGEASDDTDYPEDSEGLSLEPASAEINDHAV